jgi:hypothetical protein
MESMSGSRNKVYYKDGQCIWYLWVPAAKMQEDIETGVKAQNRDPCLGCGGGVGDTGFCPGGQAVSSSMPVRPPSESEEGGV